MKTFKTTFVGVLMFLFTFSVVAPAQVAQGDTWQLGFAYHFPDLNKTVTYLDIGFQFCGAWGGTKYWNAENQYQVSFMGKFPQYPEILDTTIIQLSVLKHQNLKYGAMAITLEDSSRTVSLGYYGYIDLDHVGVQEIKFPLKRILKEFAPEMTHFYRMSINFILASEDSCGLGLDVAMYKILSFDSVKTLVYFDPTVTGISRLEQIPKEFVLEQNYPNPFNPSTKIRFSVLERVQANLTVFNSLGQEIKILLNKEIEQGSYEVDFNAPGLPSGTYFYRLVAGGQMTTKQMKLIK